MMDLNKIVSDTVARMSNEGVIEKEIKTNIETSVKSSIKSLLGGYSFQQSIENKLQTEVDEMLKDFSFAAYGDMIRNNMLASIKEIVGYELSEQAKKSFDSLFGEKSEPIKLSEIIDTFKSAYDYADYDEKIELSIKHRHRDSNSKVSWINYEITLTRGSDKMSLHLQAMCFKDEVNEFRIYHIQSPNLQSISKESPQLFNQKLLETYEILLLNAFFSDRKVDIDVTDGDEVDLYIHEQEY